MNRFHHIPFRMPFHRPQHSVDGVITCHHHDTRRSGKGARAREHVQSAHPRQADIQQNHVDVVVLKSEQRLCAICGLVGLVARVVQPCGDHVP